MKFQIECKIVKEAGACRISMPTSCRAAHIPEHIVKNILANCANGGSSLFHDVNIECVHGRESGAGASLIGVLTSSRAALISGYIVLNSITNRATRMFMSSTGM